MNDTLSSLSWSWGNEQLSRQAGRERPCTGSSGYIVSPGPHSLASDLRCSPVHECTSGTLTHRVQTAQHLLQNCPNPLCCWQLTHLSTRY